MTLTLARCGDEIEHTLGGPLPPNVSLLELVNRAGQWFTDTHPWNYNNRTGSLGTTAGQSYVALSGLTGFARMVSVRYSTSTLYYLQEGSLDAVLNARANSINGRPSVYAISWNVSAQGVLSPRMELSPTPSQTESNVFTAWYVAGWQVPYQDTDTSQIVVPDYCEGVFLEVLRAVARGIEEEDVADVATRLNALRKSTLFEAAIRRDGMTQTNYGPVRGGGAAMSSWAVGVIGRPESIL